jgi:hypothetical protein
MRCSDGHIRPHVASRQCIARQVLSHTS